MKLLKKLLKEAEGSSELIFRKVFHDEKSKFDVYDGVIKGFFEDMIKKTEGISFFD
ncbi:MULTISPECIES: hypothetical protein [Heyndrickxia]|uniref:hypothetical protein n=1 Tax=Heyndrickxia TaxID=2837504 RepID=UPI000AE0D682|nr:hypothetical protein [Heyndrickxia shackletonii]NEZ01349.1 hypothetical protein [Heyndrickxia shackletonii]